MWLELNDNPPCRKDVLLWTSSYSNFLCAFFCLFVARAKGYPVFLWFAVGYLMSVIAVAAIVVIVGIETKTRREQMS